MAMTVSEIQLYQILKTKLGDKVAEELVSFVKSEVHNEFDARKQILATKEDIYIIKQDIYDVKVNLMRSIYVVGLIQFLAIIGSVLAIINFTVK